MTSRPGHRQTVVEAGAVEVPAAVERLVVVLASRGSGVTLGGGDRIAD